MGAAFRKLTFCLGTALLLALHSKPAAADLITFSFSGTVTSVDQALSDTISPGDTISGTYTFESTTPDSSPFFTREGFYFGANTELSIEVGSYKSLHSVLGSSNLIRIFTCCTDVILDNTLIEGVATYEVFMSFVGPDINGAVPEGFFIGLIDDDEAALNDDTLSTSPPVLDLFEHKLLVLSFQTPVTPSTRFSVFATLDSLQLQQVPEPSALWLLAVGVAAVVPMLRRRFK